MIQVGDVYRIRMYLSDGIRPKGEDSYRHKYIINCYVNCYQLHQVSSARLEKDCYKGKIFDDDFELIVECVKNSPLVEEKTLKRFGIGTLSPKNSWELVN